MAGRLPEGHPSPPGKGRETNRNWGGEEFQEKRGGGGGWAPEGRFGRVTSQKLGDTANVSGAHCPARWGAREGFRFPGRKIGCLGLPRWMLGRSGSGKWEGHRPAPPLPHLLTEAAAPGALSLPPPSKPISWKQEAVLTTPRDVTRPGASTGVNTLSQD